MVGVEPNRTLNEPLLRSGVFPGLVLVIGEEYSLRIGDEVGRYRLVGTEADGLVLLWQQVR